MAILTRGEVRGRGWGSTCTPGVPPSIFLNPQVFMVGIHTSSQWHHGLETYFPSGTNYPNYHSTWPTRFPPLSLSLSLSLSSLAGRSVILMFMHHRIHTRLLGFCTRPLNHLTVWDCKLMQYSFVCKYRKPLQIVDWYTIALFSLVCRS